MTEDMRREPTPDEAYRLANNIGTDEELTTLQAEVKPPGLPGKPRDLALGAKASESPLKAAIANMPVRYKVRAIGVAVAVILLVIIGHVVGGGGGIKVGDCVTTITNPLDNNSHIYEASCSKPPAQVYYKVLQVQDGSSGECTMGDTVFQDDPSSRTYCLETEAGTP